MKRRRLPADPTLLQINELASHWHKQMNRLGEGSLNGRYQSVLSNAEHTEERLDGLWLKRRKFLAQPDADRFKDVIGEQGESVFDSFVHIGTCS